MRLVTRWRVARRPGAHTPTSKIEKSVAEWVTSKLTLQPAPVGRTISIVQAGTGQPATVLPGCRRRDSGRNGHAGRGGRRRGGHACARRHAHGLAAHACAALPRR
jgi:hypothetical protein